ncbi:hypothetical protein [Klebsiella pneumoniae]|uniref:hypothetical protein n=1 Tax=Klebsiella pneumoniae TaxID=573 RepID=UPI0037C1279C
MVRDYLVRGLLRPVACTTGGYGVFDAADGAQAAAQLAVLRQLVERRRAALAHLDAQLASMPAERAHEEALP